MRRRVRGRTKGVPHVPVQPTTSDYLSSQHEEQPEVNLAASTQSNSTLPTTDAIPAHPTALPNDISASSSSRAQEGWPWGKSILWIESGRLMPDGVVREITKIMQGEIAIGGYAWKNVPGDLRSRYWDQFKNMYTWDPIYPTEIVHALFLKHAGNRYTGLVSGAKANFRGTTKRPPFLSQLEWDRWLTYWNLPEVEAKSQQASMNRLSDSLGDGSGYSVHTGGSRSTVSYEKEFREKHGKDPTAVDTFLIIHTKKRSGDGEPIKYIDDKSKKIAMDVESRISAAQETAQETGEEVDKNQIFVDVVGGLKKQRLYGVGSSKYKYIEMRPACSSSTTSNVNAAALQTQVENLTQELAERDAKLAERDAKLAERDAHLQQALEAERVARTEMQSQMQAQMAQMKQMMDNFQRQAGSSSQP